MYGKKFIICGLTGWCLEVAFTSADAILKKDKKMTGKSSAWMFPIYGMASCIGKIYPKIKKWPTLVRGALYSIGIMTGEFISGSFLKKFHICPWDYSGSKYNIKGLVRLDYFPYWALAGLAFERLLCKQGTTEKSLKKPQ